MPSAIAEIRPAISADELAWLATQDDVEARLVFTERDAGLSRYRVAHGPFSETELSSLPETDWTLLVQDVEKHLPAFRDLLSLVPFIPSWRVDDLMVSVAAPGGSVGPHRDNYDVFLCQGPGERHWKLTSSDLAELDPDSHELSLVKPFPAREAYLARENDVLYIPPGTPHWGVANELCITYSIGMRAPSAIELRLACESLWPEALAEFEPLLQESQRFYSDISLQQSEAIGGVVSTNSIQRLRAQQLLPATLTDEQIAVVLGTVVTDLKAWLEPEGMSREAALSWLASRHANDIIAVHGMSRVAGYFATKGGFLFANGRHYRLSAAEEQIAKVLTAQRKIDIADLLGTSDSRELALWLLEHGVLATDDIAGEAESAPKA